MAKAKKKRSLSERADALLGFTPEYRRSLGFRNPALKRRAYRLGYESARRNPGDAGAALVAAERTVIFREAAVADLAGAREFFVAGHADGLSERGNPKAQSAFDRCVAEVSKKGGAYDPRAVCAAAGRKKYGRAEMTRRAVAGKKRAARNPRNPLDTSQAAYEGFHGEPSKGGTTVQEKSHYHTHVWELGKLTLMRIALPSDRREPGLKNTVDLEFDYEGKNPARLTGNEERNQLFIDGGDQAVDVEVFGIDKDSLHEKEFLGWLKEVWYFTDKKHLGKDGGVAVYKHKLGEEGGELPGVVYRVIDKRLEIVGGSYTIPDEGVRN